MSRSRRGSALLVTLGLLAAIAALSAALWVRFSAAGAMKPDEERRTQLLWLARSAAQRAVKKTPVKIGEAQVTVASTASGTSDQTTIKAEATWPGVGTARVEVAREKGARVIRWTETYDRAMLPE